MSGFIPWVVIVSMGLGLGLGVGAAAAQPANEKHAALHALFKEYWELRLMASPERATYLGDFRYNDQLTDYSEETRRSHLDAYRSMQRRLSAIPRSRLGADDALNADLFARTLREIIDLSQYPEHLMPIKQQNSPHIELGMIKLSHPFETPKDCRDYAARLMGFPRQVDVLIERMEEGMRLGIIRPKVTIEQVLPQIEAMIRADPRDCDLYTPAKKLTDAQGGEAARNRIAGATRLAMGGLRKLHRFLKDTYLPACRDTVGYCHLRDGKAWYRRLAQHHTTTDLTPEEIHAIGLDEMKRIRVDMRVIIEEVAFHGDLGAFFDHLRTDPTHNNTSAADMMRRHRAILKRSDANLSKLFGTLPRTPYDLKELEAFRAESAPAGYYYNAPDDGSRPAYFYVNTHRPETRPIYTMEALAYHEAMPGHHLQLALAQEKRGWPAFRRFESINAYIEGWGLYAETLGYELGGYRDPYSRFGQLTFDAWRASRLVVDTGLHYFGWTRRKAIAYMKDNTALSKLDIISEIDRYIAWPGQALAYKIGQREILSLRAEAEKALGGRFDVRAFHDHLLAEGSLPLSVLRERMRRWIEQMQGGDGAGG